MKQLIHILLNFLSGAEIIYTTHAEERMKQRKVSKTQIESAVRIPDEQKLEDDGDTRFIKSIRRPDKKMRALHVVGKPIEKRFLFITSKWLIKTVYVRGEED